MVKLVDLRRGSYAAAGKGESYERALQSFRTEAAFYEQCAPVLEQVASADVHSTFQYQLLHLRRTDHRPAWNTGRFIPVIHASDFIPDPSYPPTPQQVSEQRIPACASPSCKGTRCA